MFGTINSFSIVPVLKGLEDAWKNKEFIDITVQVSDTIFECHSLVLAVSSGFFKAHLKNSTEPEQRHVTIGCISAETFKLILTMLYSGTYYIKKDTVIELWHAAHHLQIPFLIGECEKFITSFLSLQNYKTVYASAKQLDRPEVLNCVLNFIAKNFNSCKDSDFIPHLTGDEMLRILQNEDLEVKSEHDVIEAILTWVDYPPLVRVSKQTEHDSDLSKVVSKQTEHDSDLSKVVSKQTEHDSDLSKVVSKQTEHDSDISKVVSKQTEHDSDIIKVVSKETEHDSDLSKVSNQLALHENEMIIEEDRNKQLVNGKMFDYKHIKTGDETFHYKSFSENPSEAQNILSDFNEKNILDESSKNLQKPLDLVATQLIESQNLNDFESMETSKKYGRELGQHLSQPISEQPLDSELRSCDHLSVCDKKRDTVEYKTEPNSACLTLQECNSEERLKYLVPLLQASKTCLLTPQHLGQLYHNKHIACNIEARDIIFKATLYQSDLSDQSHWPTSAIHRKSSHFEHVGLFIDKNGSMNIFSCLSKKWHKISMLKPLIFVDQITVYKNELYALWSNGQLLDTMFHLYVWKGFNWVKISDILKDNLKVEKEKDWMNVFTAAASQLADFSKDPTNDNTKVPVKKDTESTVAPISFSGLFASTNIVEKSNKGGLSFSVSTPGASITPTLITTASTTTNPTTTASTTTTSTNSFWNPLRLASANTNIFKEAGQTNKAAVGVFGINFSSTQKTPVSFNTENVKSVSTDANNKEGESDQQFESLMSKQPVSNPIHLISHGNYIYIIHLSQIQRVDPQFPDASFEMIKLCLVKEKIDYVSSFDEFLLLFCSDPAEINKTIIYVYNTNTEEARRLTILDGPASGLVTFQGDDNKYMLQSNGALWTITRIDNSIDFSFLIKLWDFECKLNGGIVYNGELFLQANHCSISTAPLNIHCQDRFKNINLHRDVNSSSRFVPFIVLKKTLLNPKVHNIHLKKRFPLTKRHKINY